MKRNLFVATEELAEKLFSMMDLPLFDDSKRLAVSNISCSMSLDHWKATLNLLEGGLLPSAVVIQRAQFESLLRSIWLLYAANDGHIEKLSAKLTPESEQNAKNLPQVAEMIMSLSKKGPPQAFDALNRFKENSWKALNSYAHAGIHPMRRHAEGYPVELIESITRNSNGLAILSAMQVVVLAGTQSLQKKILNLASQYNDCMPPAV